MSLQLRNSATQYGLVGRSLHWTSVALLVTMIVTAAGFEDLDLGPERAVLIRQHASFGLILLALMCLRLGWRCYNPNPLQSYSIKSWQKSAALFLHRGIYALVISQCLLGIASLLFAAKGIPFFSLFEGTAILNRQVELQKVSQAMHYALSIMLYPLFAIHISAAIYHQLFGVLDE